MMAGLRIISVTLGLCALYFAGIYLGPTGLAVNARMTGQPTVVQTINSFGPIWPILFAIAGGGVLGSLTSGCRLVLVLAHGVAAAVWVFFGLTSLTGALLSQPPIPVLTGGLAISAAVIHYGAARCWSDWGIK